MRGDGKAVGFIAHALHQIQTLRLAWQQRPGADLPGQEQLLILLGQPGDGILPLARSKLFQHLHRPAQLAFAAIHDQQVRQQRK